MRVAVTMLVFCVAALLALGLVMLYSAGMTEERGIYVGAQYLAKQATWCVLGLMACAVATWSDYRWLKRFAIPLLVITLVLLILVLIPQTGTRVNGASRWLDVPVRWQPSEVAKIALILALAWYCERYQRFMGTWKRGVAIPGIIIASVLGLIFVEPDRGTTVLLAAISGCMLLIAGARFIHFVPPVLVAVVAFAFSLFHDSMRSNRILSWLELEQTKEGVGYQAYQAMLALGSGGWFGLGLGNGRQKLGFIPFHHTDFIFSVIGEELGFVATLLVVLAFITILVCGIYISLRSPDTFGLLLGSGISLLISIQAAINIGVVTSALPNKGLPLPFISYGGSSLMMMLAGVGLLLSIARRAKPGEVLLRASEREESRENPFRAPEKIMPARTGGAA